jgi:hypothetical protein
MLMLAINYTAFSQTTFIKLYGGAGTDSGRFVEFTSDGGYIVVGHTTTNSNGFADMYVLRVNSVGDTLWSKKIGGPGVEQGYTIKLLNDGNYIISGFTTSTSNNSRDAYLVKIDDSGNILWEKKYGGSGNDGIEAAFPTPDGGFILTGYSTSTGTNGSDDLYLVKTDAAGNELWSKFIGGPAQDWGNMVQPTPDGGYIILGITYSFGAGGGDYYLVRTDASGNVMWSKTYGGANLDEGKNIRVTSDGGFIVTGDTDSFGAGNSDIYVIKTDANGDSLWTKTYGGADKDVSKMIEPTPDGGYIIAGISRSFGLTDPDFWIIKTDGTGSVSWTKEYGGNSNEHCYALRPTSDGGYIAVGHSASFGNLEQVYLLKLDANGEATPSSVEQLSMDNILIYPNPINTALHIDLSNYIPGENLRVELIDQLGRIIYSPMNNDFSKSSTTIDMSSFPRGAYLLRFHTGKKVISKSIILN